MARIVSIHAASHTPVMLNFADAIPAGLRDEIFAGFQAMGAAIAQARPQAIVVLSDDHVHNFFLDNLPAFCIGAASAYPAPIEHWLKADKRMLTGDPALGAALLEHMMASDFDPALSMELTLDHGIVTPLDLAGVARSLPVVPVLINCVQPPLPRMGRCHAFGVALGKALRAYPQLERVSVLATGGLSHDLSTPRMGMVNEAFDTGFLRLIEQGDPAPAIQFAEQHVHEAGNGAEEVRMWLMAMGIAGSARFVSRLYRPVPGWYTGIGIGEWVQ